MKQAKKMLCMLLVMLLAFSTVSIGVNAAYTSYATPSGQTLHEKALYTTAQRGSQLLDYVDEMLAELNFNEDYVVIKLNLTSVDAALDTVASLESAAGAVGGDVKKLDFDAVPTTRRGTSGATDLNILYELLYFLHANRDIVAKFVNGNLDLGVIGSFVDLDINVHNLLVDMLYEMMVDESYDPDVAPIDYNTWTADKIIQHGLEVILAGGKAADGDIEEGFLPSLGGKLNINSQSMWEIIELAANAATKDILLPFIKNDLGDLLDEAKEANPNPAWDYIDISKLNLDNYVWGQYDSKNGLVAELNHFLYVVIDQVWTGEKFWVDGGNEKLEENLAEAIKIVYEKLGKLILPASAEFLPQEEINAMNFQELVSYVAMQFLRSEMPYLIFETADPTVEIPTDNLSAIACTIAYSILAELPISGNYMEDFEYGRCDWDKKTALNMVADIGAYYLNGALPVDINYGEGVEMLMTKLVNWALGDNNFGGFFKGCGISDSDTAWQKIDKTVLTVLPLHKILGGGATGSYDLIMNKLLDNVLTLNLEGILSLLYKADYSLLNDPAPKFVVNILNRVLGVIVTRNTKMELFNSNPPSIDSLIQNANLAVTAKELLTGLYNAGRYEYFWSSLLPILNPILIDESGYACNIKNPTADFTPVNTLEGLQNYVESIEAAMTEPDNVYDMTALNWNESEDYRLWRYDQLEDAIDDAWGVIDGYPAAVEWVASANEQLATAQASGDQAAIDDAKANLADAQANLDSYNADKYNKAAGQIDYYTAKVLGDQNVAEIAALQYVVYIIEYAKGYDSSAYPEDVWVNFQTALNHANAILDISPELGSGANPDLKQSMVNAARRNLLDAMRLLDIDLADLTALIDKLAEAEAADTAGKNPAAVERLEALIAEAKELTSKAQIIDMQARIDELVIELQEAIEALSAVILPTLEKRDKDVEIAVVNGLNLVYSLATNLSVDELLDKYVTTDEANGKIEVETVVDGVVGTGSVIKVLQGEEVIEEHTVVIFGDANGDGIVDIMDTIYLDLHIAEEKILEGAQFTALDLIADAALTSADVTKLDIYANFEGEIDQSKVL